MLLGDGVLSRAARIWRYREKTELEAACEFTALAHNLKSVGANSHIVELARRCAIDEKRHALLCRRLVDEFEPGLAPLPIDKTVLGLPKSSTHQRALFASVALCCITESLSVALLLEMQSRTTHPETKLVVREILKDEIRHSRLGWAYLSATARIQDVSWLSEFVPEMIRCALTSTVEPVGTTYDLRPYAILSTEQARKTCEDAIHSIVRPGLAKFGIEIGEVGTWNKAPAFHRKSLVESELFSSQTR